VIKEFKPTIFFLLKFLGLYFLGNLVYGWFVTSCYPDADPITRWVTVQTTDMLNILGWPCKAVDIKSKATVAILHNSEAVVSVYRAAMVLM